MNKYEGVFIYQTQLAKQGEQAVEQIIQKEGGQIDKVDDWGKRRLAYEINKITEAHYQLIYFTIDSSKIERIQSLFKLNETIIKFLVTRFDPSKQTKPQRVVKKEEDQENSSQEVASEEAASNA